VILSFRIVDYGGMLEARDADTKTKQRVVLCALVYAKREHA
jgi:hypothetical protein